jgi:hypothetical protein
LDGIAPREEVEAQPLKPRALDLMRPPSAAHSKQQQHEQQQHEQQSQEQQSHEQQSHEQQSQPLPPPPPMPPKMFPRPDLMPGKHLTSAFPAVPRAAAPDNGDMHKVVFVPVGML